MILDNEIDHEKISNMTLPELKQLCRELRRCILSTVDRNRGTLVLQSRHGRADDGAAFCF